MHETINIFDFIRLYFEAEKLGKVGSHMNFMDYISLILTGVGIAEVTIKGEKQGTAKKTVVTNVISNELTAAEQELPALAAPIGTTINLATAVLNEIGIFKHGTSAPVAVTPAG